MDGNKDVTSERLYALAGAKNFAMIRFREPSLGGDAEIIVDLHWPGGEEGEVTRRRILL